MRVSGHGAGQLRRIAREERDGVLTIDFTDTGWLARIVASSGTAAQVLDPPDLIAAVVDRLRAVAGER